MRGPQGLSDTEDRWNTKMGAWLSGERVVYRGKDLFKELNDKKWMALLLYGITGRIFNDKQIRLFEGLYCLCSSFPDPRLWNNRIAALASTARSTITLGIAAAVAVSEAKIYGHKASVGAIDFLLRTQEKVKNGRPLDVIIEAELKKYRWIPGYGRPIIATDERIDPVMDLANSLGFADGPFVRLAFEIERILQNRRRRINMNIASLSAALAADQGLTPTEYHYYVTPCFLAGIMPCVIDGMNGSEGTFLPLRCTRIACQGRSRRAWDNT